MGRPKITSFDKVIRTGIEHGFNATDMYWKIADSCKMLKTKSPSYRTIARRVNQIKKEKRLKDEHE